MPGPGNVPERGDIYWMDFNPARGSEQAGHRPALVISDYRRHHRMQTAVVVALTTTVHPRTRSGVSPVTVFLPAGRPLQYEGSVLAHQVQTVSLDRLEDFAGCLDEAQMEAVSAALRVSFGL